MEERIDNSHLQVSEKWRSMWTLKLTSKANNLTWRVMHGLVCRSSSLSLNQHEIVVHSHRAPWLPPYQGGKKCNIDAAISDEEENLVMVFALGA